MSDLAVQYLLIFILILGFLYLIYVLKENSDDKNNDFFGLRGSVLNSLDKEEATYKIIEDILEAVFDGVNYVELNYKDEESGIKEEKALSLVKKSILNMDLKSNISDDNIIHLIRVAYIFYKCKINM